MKLSDLPPYLRSQAEELLGLREIPHTPHRVQVPPPHSLRMDKMSQTEKRFFLDVLHGQGQFEAITLKSPSGNRYTPDFFCLTDGVPTLYEVKGSYRLGSEGRARTAFLEAASQFSSVFRFVWVALNKNGSWDMKMMIPRDAPFIGE